MPRCAREKSQSGIYHIMIRGINGQNILQEKEDFEKLISLIQFTNYPYILPMSFSQP